MAIGTTRSGTTIEWIGGIHIQYKGVKKKTRRLES